MGLCHQAVQFGYRPTCGDALKPGMQL